MIPEAMLAGYAGLFAAAFVAATILPAQSELLLTTMLVSGRFEPWALLVMATAGNVLGSLVNWGLGRHFAHFRNARWFPASPAVMDRAEHWFGRFGAPVLLLSWLPIIGDPLTVAAGVLRMRFAAFLIVVTMAKAARYLVLAAVVTGWAA